MNQTTRRTIITAAGAVGIASALPRFAIGQPAWPSEPIRIVVTNPAGGLTDQYARHYGEFLSRKFGQPVVVENKPGASGTIAADAVAKSAPDGHTLLVAIQTTVWTARVLYRTLPFNPDRDLAPISLFPAGALAMAVHEKIPARTPKEFVEFARRTPATFGTYSPASLPHLICDAFNRSAGLNIQPIHYKGESPMWVDVSTGQINAGLGSFQAMQTYLQRGAIRPVAVVGSRRNPRMPEVPTFSEQGITDPVFVLDGWIPMCAPAGTPPEILQKISDALVEGFATPKLKTLHEALGIPNGPTTLEETKRRWRDDAPQWIAAADRLGIKLD